MVIDPAELSDKAKFAITTFLVWLHDIISFLAHGRRITDLVRSAINGNDEAICLAVQIDKSILALPVIRARVDEALRLENDEDTKFVYNLCYRMQNPVLRGQIKQRNVWIALLLLDSMNLLDGSLTRTELLSMLDEAGIEGVGSEDNLSRMLRRFRAYRFHDLRHTWASWHRQNGTSCDELKELGGWKSRSMVDRYAKFATEHLAVAASRIESDRGGNVLQLSRFSHAGIKAA